MYQIHSTEKMAKLTSGIIIHNINNYNIVNRVMYLLKYVYIWFNIHFYHYSIRYYEPEHKTRPWFTGHCNVFTMIDDKTYHATGLQILHNEEPLQ